MELPIDDLQLVAKHLFEKSIEKKDQLSKIDIKFYNKNGYEELFCPIYDMQCIYNTDKEQRYADAFITISNRKIKIELKKSSSSGYFIDLVRIGEIIRARKNKDKELIEQAAEESLTLFIQTGKRKIKGEDKEIRQLRKFYLLDTSELIRFINMNDSEIECCKYMKEKRGNINNQLAIRMSELLKYTSGVEIRFEKTGIYYYNVKNKGLQTDIPRGKDKIKQATKFERLVYVITELIEDMESDTIFTSKELFEKLNSKGEWKQKDFTDGLNKWRKGDGLDIIEKDSKYKGRYKKL